MRTIHLVCACAASAALAAPAAAQPGTEVTGSTATARVTEPTVARAAPAVGARRVLDLMPYTAFSRRDQVLMVTGDATDDSGRPWVRVMLPVRPSGTEGWVPASQVKRSAVHSRIRVVLGAKRLELWRNGRRVLSTRAAVGTGSTPTPVGAFAVQDPVTTPASARGVYGPYIITLTAYSSVLKTFMGGNGLVAIHGTSDTGSLGRAASHGCVRISNSALVKVRPYADAGVPVDIVR